MSLNESKLGPQAAADLMFQRLQEGGASTAKAARMMAGELGRWMDRYFMRFGIPEQEAVELTMDVWVKVLDRGYDVRSNGFALLCRMRKSRLADYIKRRRAGKRSADTGGAEPSSLAAETMVSDEAWDLLAESVAVDTVPDWLTDCVQRKVFAFQQISPARAELLELVASGLSYREIAGVVFDLADPDVTQQYVNRVRNRIEEARRQAGPYFDECKESSK